MPIQTTFQTNRLKLRPLFLSDAKAIQEAASSQEVAKNMISIPHPYPEKEADRYIKRQIKEFKQRRSVTFVLEEKTNQAFLGLIEVRDIDWEHWLAELSFWLKFEAWGQGYMSEALPCVLAYVFKDLNMNRLYAYHLVKNQASGRVLEKSGFVQEGVLRQGVKIYGVFEDVILKSLLKQEWQDRG